MFYVSHLSSLRIKLCKDVCTLTVDCRNVDFDIKIFQSFGFFSFIQIEFITNEITQNWCIQYSTVISYFQIQTPWNLEIWLPASPLDPWACRRVWRAGCSPPPTLVPLVPRGGTSPCILHGCVWPYLTKCEEQYIVHVWISFILYF